MSKNNKTPFQLKPKHLIRALFLVSFIAVAALVAGVFSTLNSGKTDVPEKSPAEQTDTRIEVWRPNGTVEPETVQPAKDGDAKTASGNPIVPQNEKGEKAEEGVKNDRPTTHRSKRTENKRVEADKSEKTQSDNSNPAAQNTPQACRGKHPEHPCGHPTRPIRKLCKPLCCKMKPITALPWMAMAIV